MRKALSAILAMCMILGCIAVGFTAQAAPPDLADAIAAAIANNQTEYTWNGGSTTLTKSIVINPGAGKNFTVDFGGAIIQGAAGTDAVIIQSGNVTLTNGTIYANFENYQQFDILKLLMGMHPAAVRVNGGSLSLEYMALWGGMLRVPSTNETVPAGNAIKVRGGKDLNLKHVLAIGFEGVHGKPSGDFVIDDSIVFGINEAVYFDGYTIPEGSKEYKTLDCLKDVLYEGDDYTVTLTANEERYLNELFERAGNLCFVASDPEFAEPEFTYNPDTDVLTVTVEADDKDLDADYNQMYSYRYIPVSISVNGTEAAAVETSNGVFTATFNNIPAATECSAEINWKLAVLMDSYQAADVSGFFETMKNFVSEDLPSMVNSFFTTFEREYDTIYTILQGMWDLYDENKNNPTYASAIAEYEADLAPLFGPLFDLCGAKLDTNGYASALNAKNTGRVAIWNSFLSKLESKWGATKMVANQGKGLLDYFDEYYDEFKATLYPNDQLTITEATVKAAAKFIGDNYDDIYDILKSYVPAILNSLDNAFQNPNSSINEMVAGSELENYIGYISDAKAAVNDVFAMIDDFRRTNDFISNVENNYDVGNLCATYAEKAWRMATTPEKYFELDVVDDSFRLFDWMTEATYTTPADEIVGYNVTLVVTGSGGYASLNGTETSASYTELIPAGELANISVRSEGSQFIGLFYSQPGTSGTSIRFSPSLESFRVGSNITVEARFSGLSTSADLHQVTLLTDSNLSYSQIASNAFAYGQFDAYGFAGFDPDEDYPVAKGLEFVGWSLDEDPDNAVEYLDDLAAFIDEIEEDVIVYAVYTGEDELVTIDQDVAVALKSSEYDAESGRVYFTVDYLIPEGYRGIQAGIIATKNASLATVDKMNLDLIGTSGVVVSRADTFYDGDGYLLPAFEFALGVRSASGTIYGRGYIVLQNIETGEVTTVYTDEIGSGTIGG